MLNFSIKIFNFLFKNAFIISILILSSFLITFRLGELAPFIGDQAWFYLSARDFLLTGNLPLVGITSSHTWLHQGPFWTYILIPLLWIFNFNPITTIYVTTLIGVATTVLVYFVGIKMFSKRIGLISALLYATSPLIIIYSRMSYHTLPIPFFTLCYMYSLYRWVKGKALFFPLSIFFLAVLYNFELATAVLGGILITIILFGVWCKNTWFKKILNKKMIALSLLSFTIPMLPMIIYDLSHGFKQTLGFGVWIIYRTISFFGYSNKHTFSLSNFGEMTNFLSQNYLTITFPAIKIISALIFTLSILWLVNELIEAKLKKPSSLILSIFFIIPIVGLFLNQTPSEAYLPMIFPPVVIVASVSLDKLIKNKRILLFIVLIIAFINSFTLLANNYFVKSLTIDDRIIAAKEIIKIVGERKYNLVGKEEGSEFESFTMNQEYLLWWLGKPVSKQKQETKIIIIESKNSIKLD